MKCNYCGNDEAEVVAEYTRLEKNNVLQCKDCGLVYLDLGDEKGGIESYYADGYRKSPRLPQLSPAEHLESQVAKNDVSNRIQFIQKHIKIQGEKILEMGSASGGLLDKMLECDANEVAGVELDEAYSKFAKDRGLKILTESMETLGISAEFDAIVTFHTLEHVYDPKSVIDAVYLALRDGGCFLGEVPNQNDWRIQIFDNEVVKRFHYDPNHYFYFSPQTVKNYFKNAGFRDIHFETVERYNSMSQLKDIICNPTQAGNIEHKLNQHIFPETEKDEVRLPGHNETELKFNKVFEKGVNSELMGNCLRWIAYK